MNEPTTRSTRRAFPLLCTSTTAVLLVVAACGGTGDDGAAGPRITQGTGPIAAKDLPRAFAEALCAAAERCELSDEIAVLRQAGHCLDGVERAVAASNAFSALAVAAAAGTVSYDAQAARACVDAMVNQCPASGPAQFSLLINFTPLRFCPDILASPCELSPRGRWAPPAQEGEECGAPTYRTCGAGLACGATCMPAVEEGGDCSNGERCAAGFRCPTDDGTRSSARVCAPVDEAYVETVLWMLAEDRPPGAPCTDEVERGVLGACNPGAQCDPGPLATGDWTCAAFVEPGKPCGEGMPCAGICDAGTCRAADCELLFGQ